MRFNAQMGLAAWRNAISHSFVSLITETDWRTQFVASMNVTKHNSMMLTSIRAQPHTVRRTPELINTDASKNVSAHYYKVSFQTQGYGLLIQDGREVHLAPGSLAIYDTSRPYVVSFETEFSSHIMMFPHSRLSLSQDAVEVLTATLLGSGRQLGQMASQMMVQAAKTLPGLPEGLGNRLASNVVDVINTLVADELLGVSGARTTRKQLQLAQIRNYIDDCLTDYNLNVATIASAHHMSIRSLHYLFEGERTSVTELIRQRRVEMARLDLADTFKQAVPVSTIGARWGFADPAYFSRVFRRTIGMSPSEYRRQLHGGIT